MSRRQVHQDDLENLAFVHLRDREKKKSGGRRGVRNSGLVRL
jgi:hypothetical protein